jgi:hypothetical protein
MKRLHDDDVYENEPKQMRCLDSEERRENLKYFQSLCIYEQLHFLYTKEGLISELVGDVTRLVLMFMLKIKGCKLRFYKNVRVFSMKEDPIVFTSMLRQYETKQRQSVDESRKKLINNGVGTLYIHVLVANVPVDGMGSIRPYDDCIYIDKKSPYNSFTQMHISVDIRDRSKIREFLSKETVSDEALQRLEDQAKGIYHSYMPSLWTQYKAFFFLDDED